MAARGNGTCRLEARRSFLMRWQGMDVETVMEAQRGMGTEVGGEKWDSQRAGDQRQDAGTNGERDQHRAGTLRCALLLKGHRIVAT